MKIKVLDRQPKNMTTIYPIQSALHRCFFNIRTCRDAIEDLRMFKNKYDKKTSSYTDIPEHSDIADAFRSLIEGLTVQKSQEFMYRQFKNNITNMNKKKLSPIKRVKKKMIK